MRIHIAKDADVKFSFFFWLGIIWGRNYSLRATISYFACSLFFNHFYFVLNMTIKDIFLQCHSLKDIVLRRQLWLSTSEILLISIKCHEFLRKSEVVSCGLLYGLELRYVLLLDRLLSKIPFYFAL